VSTKVDLPVLLTRQGHTLLSPLQRCLSSLGEDTPDRTKELAWPTIGSTVEIQVGDTVAVVRTLTRAMQAE
jgi:hypothetical protein